MKEGLDLATEKGLDLLLVTNKTDPCVCKLIDYGQFKYEQHKKEKQAKKGTKGQTVKEIKMGPNISIHDFNFKLAQGQKFLEKGYKVKVTIFFKGREQNNLSPGYELIKKFQEAVKDICGSTTDAARSGRFLSCYINAK